MNEVDADRKAKEALCTARARAGDSESATTSELLRMMRNDAVLQEALTVLGVARLWESQNVRH